MILPWLNFGFPLKDCMIITQQQPPADRNVLFYLQQCLHSLKINVCIYNQLTSCDVVTLYM